ncbi:MAG: hypothetical protein ACD_57C00191G0001 [uncultured bacterium]|uniref:PsbP C-terminal domain-containing protein n=1 Tax=Candidatus Curtissbacteria bacterium RIFOXYA1_FULL_41_14 TaxID=1797737 RepID=A0A1F5HBK0_9BACT|nr:MAG: hypothetical protein ACD_57C00191G0001 [uncultured bacterium]OGD79908.1 MAG: hypothetical protein A2683_00355 [Candidatus Curtissbacteria bacterium RIFCSPHIGHO2_01_FULL_34_40]OGD92779.1 MAG: hypothetical protein A3E14_00095 [Candidatus Curtissbacteria bacterium RIFCSPHIGHO2_12_FULL_41_13]OGD95003.1 MAG: hypothetical protein A3B52_03100 [Candidatus Curtissbacteria bacterium RIFCSPLOWO2_01_FULL_41_28]OGE01469.1 MAG: hypothetical protein A2196_03145 [Candidatus Curtissbacteria bacterium RI
MTLTSLKSKAKVYTIIILLIIYGAGAYFVGRSSAFGQILKIRKEVPQRAIVAPIESPMPYADTQSGSVISAHVKLCSNTVYGFEIAYPNNWFTTFLTDEQKCNFFAPYSFVIPKDTNENFVPIKIEIMNVDQWPGMVKFYENPNDFRNIISVQNINIGEKIIHKVKASTTDEGLLPRDYDILNYLVFDSKTPIIISYQQLSEEDDFASFEKAIEEIVNSLRFF